MATVIDKFVVELGLDPKKFTQGQREAIASFKRTSDEARARANDFEEQARRSANFFSNVRREAVGLLAAVAGGYGIKQLVSNLVTGDAAVGRFARSTGIAAGEVAKFDKALELAGGGEGTGKGALAALNNQIQDFRAGLGGNILPIYNQMQAEGGHVIDINKTVIEQMLAIARNARAIEAKTPGRGGFYLRQLGMPEDAINVLIRGDQYLGAMLDKAEKLGAANKESVASAERFLEAWRTTGQLIVGLLRPLEVVASDTLDAVNAGLKKALENQESFYAVPKEHREAVRNERINKAIGITDEQHKGVQEWFAQSWLGRLLGVKQEDLKPLPPTGTGPGRRTTFEGMSSVIGNPQFPAPATYGAASRFGGVGSAPAGSGDINITNLNVTPPPGADAITQARAIRIELEGVMEKARLASQANTGPE